MYADRIEAEARTAKSRLGDGLGESLGVVTRSRVTFKKSAGRGRGRGSASDEKWQHDLFEAAESFLDTQGNGGSDLRSLLSNKKSAKLGTGARLGGVGRVKVAGLGRTGGGVGDLRQGISGRRGGGAVGGVGVGVRRRPGTLASAVVGPGQAQKRLTVTLRNEEQVVEEEPEGRREGRGRLLVTAAGDAEDVMDMDMEIPSARPAGGRRTLASKVTRGSRGVDEVTGFLAGMGLAKYGPVFQAEEIDMVTLEQMTEEDLKELGIPMGPRKKILQAAAPSQA